MMIAWHFEAPALLKLGGAGPMIRFNTAATFLLCGLAIIASNQQRRRWAVGLALLIILVALAHAIEWRLNLDTGLEYLLHQPRDEFIRKYGNGRLANSAAACFVFFGIAIIDRQSPRPHPAIASLLGYFISLMGLVALYRYGMGTDHSIGWRFTTGMAMPTALGNFLLGVSTVAMGIAATRRAGPNPWLAAYPAAFTLAVASFIIWLELKQLQSVDLRRETAAAAANLRFYLRERIMTRVHAIEDLAHNWETLPPTRRRGKVEALLAEFGSLQEIDWIDDDFRTAWRSSDAAFDPTAGKVLPLALQRDLIAQSDGKRSFAFMPASILTHSDARIVGYAPTFDDVRRRTGFMEAVFRINVFLHQLSRNKRISRFAFMVNEGDRQLYCSSATGIPRGAIVERRNFAIRGLQWQIDVWPTSATAAAQGSKLPDIALAHGLFSAALLAVAIQWRQRAARRTAEAEQSAAAWRDSEQRFELAVSATNDGLWEWRQGRTTFYASQRYRELFGYPLNGDDLDIGEWFRQLYPEDRPKVEEALQRHIRDRTPYEVVARYYKLNGELIWVSVRGTSTWDGEGRHLRMAGSTIDITQQLEAERQLLAQVDAIAAANHALTEMAGAARAATEAKSAFLRNMSHELRTPLNSIIGFSSGMLRAESSELDARQRDRLERIVASGQHLLELVNNILDIAKTEASQSRLHIEKFNLADLFDEVMAMTEILLQKKPHVRLDTSIDGGVPSPLLDQTKLKQILLNLLSNAAKFTNEGSITLRASFDRPHWQFAVSDTGIGIPQEALQRVFDNFERIEASDRSTEGTGLGLPICQLLAHAMGGAISVESRLGVGSTFTFVCPQASVETASPRAVQQEGVQIGDSDAAKVHNPVNASSVG